MKRGLVYACATIAFASSQLFAATPALSPTPLPQFRTDREIQEAVVSGLLANPEVLATNLRVRVAAGVVVLEGYVRSADARKMAEKVARSVPGVLRVKNELRLRKNST